MYNCKSRLTPLSISITTSLVSFLLSALWLILSLRNADGTLCTACTRYKCTRTILAPIQYSLHITTPRRTPSSVLAGKGRWYHQAHVVILGDPTVIAIIIVNITLLTIQSLIFGLVSASIVSLTNHITKLSLSLVSLDSRFCIRGGKKWGWTRMRTRMSHTRTKWHLCEVHLCCCCCCFHCQWRWGWDCEDGSGPKWPSLWRGSRNLLLRVGWWIPGFSDGQIGRSALFTSCLLCSGSWFGQSYNTYNLYHCYAIHNLFKLLLSHTPQPALSSFAP